MNNSVNFQLNITTSDDTNIQHTPAFTHTHTHTHVVKHNIFVPQLTFETVE